MVIVNFVRKLIFVIPKKDRILLALLVAFSVIMSVFETISIASVLPFVSLASDSEKALKDKYIQLIYARFQFRSVNDFVIFSGICIVILFLVKNILNILHQYAIAAFGLGRYHQFAYSLFEQYVSLPYRAFIMQNSGDLSKSITTEAKLLSATFSSLIQVLSGLFMLFFISTLLILVNWRVTLVLSGLLFCLFIIVMKIVSPVIARSGEERHIHQQTLYKGLVETFGNFKIIKLMGMSWDATNRIGSATKGFAKSSVTSSVLTKCPNYALETVGVAALAGIVAFSYYRYATPSAVLGTVSVFAMGFYKLLPSLNHLITNINHIVFSHKSLDIIFRDLSRQKEIAGTADLCFTEKIQLEDIRLSFDNRVVLAAINLQIHKGEKIAIVGDSGAGKSTILEVLTGILEPEKGKILIDGEPITRNNLGTWRKKFGLIPQNIYLFDGTVADNIVFGREYDEEKLKKVLQKCRIAEFLDARNGLKTIVGEGGVMVSGGQKQRIAIARALYLDPEIIVMDEGTSALDQETEQEIMKEIVEISAGKTLVIVTHRLEAIRDCSRVYRLENGILNLEKKINH